MLIRSFAVVLFILVCAALPAQAGVRIALLPISVHAAGSDSDYLQSGLSEMIAARIDQYEGVTVVRPQIEGEPPTAVVAARAAAEEVDAAFVIYGSFTRFGDGASLDLRCARVDVPTDGDGNEGSEDERRVFIQSGALTEIIPHLDTLAQKVARYALRAGAPRVAGTDDGKEPAPGPTAAQYEALVKRVEELESATIPPLAGAAEEDGVVVR